MTAGYPEDTAVHEAGHAVVASHVGIAKGRVIARVFHKAGRRWQAGRCEYEPRVQRRRRLDLEPLRAQLAVTVAGSVAEYVAAGRAHEELSPKRILQRERAPDGTDRDAHQWAVEQLAPEYRSEALAEEIVDVLAADALRRATRIVRNKWLQVAMLAEQLDAGDPITL